MWIVYKHRNSLNGKSYIGCTSKSIDDRWQEHINNALRGSDLAFHRAIRKYGVGIWEHETLEIHESSFSAYEAEKRLIAHFNTFSSEGYNLTEGGEGSTGHVYSHTPEARLKISQALRNRVVSDETRRKLSEAKKGKKWSDEQKKMLSVARVGIIPSDETREKLRKALKGRKFSEEHKAKIGAANRGRKHSEESRKNMSEARRGIIQSEETKRKRSKSLRGRVVSVETREKISAGHQRRKILKLKQVDQKEDQHERKENEE
jgi:group I intron endonuclease